MADAIKQKADERIRVILMSDIHYCSEGWYGINQKIKGEILCADLQEEYKKDPYEALLLLGDYSLDHWIGKGTYLSNGVSDTETFKKECLNKMAPNGCQVRMIAGNHEQYGEELWHTLTGFKRSDHIVLGPVLFILLDTFGGDLDPTTHSDGTYIGADVAEITELMERYPDKKVVLCAHWFRMEEESEEFKKLLNTEKRVLCLFCGHNHRSRLIYTEEDCGNKPIIFTGHYSYSGERNAVHCLNGYREVVITKGGIFSKYIVPSHTYTMAKVKFTNEYTQQDDIEIKF